MLLRHNESSPERQKHKESQLTVFINLHANHGSIVTRAAKNPLYPPVYQVLLENKTVCLSQAVCLEVDKAVTNIQIHSKIVAYLSLVSYRFVRVTQVWINLTQTANVIVTEEPDTEKSPILLSY